MEYTHMTDLLSFAQALLAGAGMGIYYDCFRAVRRIVRFSAVSVALQDFFFWCSSAAVLFFLCLYLNGGFIRIYFIVSVLLGWTGYALTAGKVFFMVFDWIIAAGNRIFDSIRSCIMRLAKAVYIKI